MFIFRFEHNRKVCTHPYFNENGESLTGHGSMKYFADCPVPESEKPQFGGSGDPPYRIMVHERCAVTAHQFDRWIGRDWYEPLPKEPKLFVKGWDLVAYWVDDDSEGIDWREDNYQIIFNPEFAINMGSVTMKDVIAIKADVNAYSYG